MPRGGPPLYLQPGICWGSVGFKTAAAEDAKLFYGGGHTLALPSWLGPPWNCWLGWLRFWSHLQRKPRRDKVFHPPPLSSNNSKQEHPKPSKETEQFWFHVATTRYIISFGLSNLWALNHPYLFSQVDSTARWNCWNWNIIKGLFYINVYINSTTSKQDVILIYRLLLLRPSFFQLWREMLNIGFGTLPSFSSYPIFPFKGSENPPASRKGRETDRSDNCLPKKETDVVCNLALLMLSPF